MIHVVHDPTPPTSSRARGLSRVPHQEVNLLPNKLTIIRAWKQLSVARAASVNSLEQPNTSIVTGSTTMGCTAPAKSAGAIAQRRTTERLIPNERRSGRESISFASGSRSWSITAVLRNHSARVAGSSNTSFLHSITSGEGGRRTEERSLGASESRRRIGRSCSTSFGAAIQRGIAFSAGTAIGLPRTGEPALTRRPPEHRPLDSLWTQSARAQARCRPATVRARYAFTRADPHGSHAVGDKIGRLTESTGPAGKPCPPDVPGSCLVADPLASHAHIIPSDGYVSVPVEQGCDPAPFLPWLKPGVSWSDFDDSSPEGSGG